VGDLTVFLRAIVGASLGFLWYNGHPAEIFFMGDVGSLSLGEPWVPSRSSSSRKSCCSSFGGIFVIEALSVILQVGSFKLRGKRIFRMARFHHHFELLGLERIESHRAILDAALVFALFAAAHAEAPVTPWARAPLRPNHRGAEN